MISKNDYLGTDKSSSHPGRPKIDYESSCSRSKRMKVNDLQENVCLDQLSAATENASKTQCNYEAAMFLKNFQKNKTLPESSLPSQNEISPEEALALILSANLTQKSYQILRNKLKNLPCYKKIIPAKNRAIPENIFVP